jgi:hypothetical protein
MHCFNTRKIIRISGSVNARMYKYIHLRGLCCFLSSYPTLRHVSASWCVYPVHDRRPDTRSAVAAWSVLHQQLTPKMSQRKIKNMFFPSTNAKNFLHLKGKFWPPRCSLRGLVGLAPGHCRGWGLALWAGSKKKASKGDFWRPSDLHTFTNQQGVVACSGSRSHPCGRGTSFHARRLAKIAQIPPIRMGNVGNMEGIAS